MVPPREERKVVTVLFADLVGFTSRAEQMDPEDVRALLAPYHARLREELERFGGTVEKFIGDAVMALFGAPVAHEDDPERAVRAALAIRDSVREDDQLEVRIAVNTGEALIVLDAQPEAGEGMAAGDVVNTTARLQAAAPVNGILVGEATFRATEHVIDYEQRDAVHAKGKEASVAVWEAIDARSRFGVDVMRAPTTALVGRERELAALRDAFARAHGDPSVQLVTIVGVPGIGKSRLVFELMEDVRRRPELVTWRQGRSLSYGEGVSLWAFGEIVKAQAGVLESDSRTRVARKIHEAVVALLPGDDAPWVESHLRPLIGLDDESAPAQSAREESFAAWQRYVEALAEVGTTVLVFEDLHWADEALLDFVMQLSEWIEDVPLLIVATARPELFDRRPDWGGGKRNATTLSLTALDRVETSRLISALLDRAVLPAEAQAVLLERADGNPFYAEQYTRMVAEGGDAGALPDTVQGIISARLDSLDLDEKTLLQSAAVLGKTFTTGGLGRMTQKSPDEIAASLRSLDRKEFIRRERRPSLSSDQEYSFRHVLLRDVAYGQIPRRTRIEQHRAAASWIESLGRTRDHAELLAHHYASAFDLTKATGGDAFPLVEPARRALRAAGDRALALNAFASAEALYRRALELWPPEDTGRASLLADYGRAVSANGGNAIPFLSEAVATAPDPETAAEAGTYLAWALWETGDTKEAFDQLHAAEARVRERPDSEAKAIVLTSLARYLTVADRDAEGVAVGREALRLAENLGLEEYRIWALHYLGLARTEDDRAAGVADLERSIALARAAKSTFLVYALNNLASISWGTFGINQALALWGECRAETERLGLRSHARFLDAIDVAAHYVLGRWDESFELADSIVREAEAGTSQYGAGPARLFRAAIRAARDDARGALEDVEQGLAAARVVRDPQAVVPALCNAIAAKAEAAGVAAVAPLIEEYFDILRRRAGGEYFYGWCGLAVDVLDQAGRGEEFLELVAWRADRCVWVEPFRATIERDYVRAAELYASIGSSVDEALARLRAAQAFASADRRAEADEQLAPALEFFRAARATRYVREGEALLAAAS